MQAGCGPFWLSLLNPRGRSSPRMHFHCEKEATGEEESSPASTHGPFQWVFHRPLSCHGANTGSPQPLVKPLMSPGGHQKSGHDLWKTGHVQSTSVLDCAPRTTSEEAITCSNIFTWDLVRGWGEPGALPALCCLLDTTVPKSPPKLHSHDIISG